jgi:predicted alpha/beta superfamily hydrolase
MKPKTLTALMAILILAGCGPSREQFEPGVHHFPDFESQYVASRNIEVWVPPGYNPRNSYDVVYMHDGQNVFNPETAYTGISWGVPEAMDTLIANGRVRPAIIVGIWNTDKRFEEYMPGKAAQLYLEENPGFEPETDIISDEYLKFIVHELKPFIDSTFSTKTAREHTYIMGSSMGGLISIYAITEYPEVFGAAASVSTHWPAADGAMLKYMERQLPVPGAHRLYFDYGTLNLDSLYEPYQREVDRMLLDRGFTNTRNWVTMKFEGADHNEASWQQRVHYPLEFLLGKE